MSAILLAGLALAGCPQNKWEQAILDKHNEWRANTQPAAKDMYKLRWDSAITANMQKWLARCDSNWPHSDQDKDRKNVGGYEFLGENLAYCAGIACEDPIDGIVGYLGQSWWDEKDDYDWANDRSTGGVTSHYTQMSSSNIYAIGCAAVECPSPGPYGWNGKWWEIGCQYGERGQGYWVGTKPFESGSGGLIEPDKSLLDKHADICLGEEDECDKTPCGMGQTCNDPDKTASDNYVCTCESDTTKTATGAAADCSTPPPTTPATPPPTPDTPPPTTPATPPPGTPATPPPATPDTPPPSNNDECQPDPCGAGQTCDDPKKTSDSLNDFTCTCDAGGAKTTGAPADCTKTTTDECAPAPCGDGQKCSDPDNTRSGDYTCTCNTDKTIVTVGMQATCSKDECMPNPCGDGQTCTDVKLSPKSLHDYECVCANGEKATGVPAQCTKDTQCANDPCGKFQTCKGQGSTFVCTCATAGATGEAEGKAAVCLFDECATDVCPKDQLCNDPDKSQLSLSDFVCTCQTVQGVQMVGSQVGGHASCRPAGANGVDECAAKVSTWTAVCGQSQLCEDTDKMVGNSYVCRCEGDASVRATGRAADCSSVRSAAENTDDDGSDKWWIWVLVGLGALLLCCAVFLLFARGKNNKSVHFNDFFDRPGEEQPQYQSHHNDPLASPVVSMSSPAGQPGQPAESMVL